VKGCVISTEAVPERSRRQSRVNSRKPNLIFPALHFVSYGDMQKITPAVFSAGRNEIQLLNVTRLSTITKTLYNLKAYCI